MRLKESPNFTVSKSEVGYTAMVLDARLLFIQGHGKDPVVALSNLIRIYNSLKNYNIPDIKKAAWDAFSLEVPTAIAAGVLIQNEDGKILSFRRADSSLYGLPFGKGEHNGTPIETAIRECREETGLGFDIRVRDPYIKSVGGFMCFTFLGKLAREKVGTLGPSTPSEGIASWQDPVAFMASNAFPEYNKGMLDHFEITT